MNPGLRLTPTDNPATPMRTSSEQRTRLLIVDDNDDMRQSLRLLLERAGYHVETAPDGIRALELQRARPFDVVLTDLFMPEMDGFEIIVELRRDFPSLKIIAMSSGGVHGKPASYLPTAGIAGADATVRKPFTIETLVEVLNHLELH